MSSSDTSGSKYSGPLTASIVSSLYIASGCSFAGLPSVSCLCAIGPGQTRVPRQEATVPREV
eukprot:47956-Alexandrium_andersonii.AAC.1